MHTISPHIPANGNPQGLQVAVSKLFNILLRLAPFFFIFSAGTNAFYVNSAVMSGQAKYQATGRGFVIVHVRKATHLTTTKKQLNNDAGRERGRGREGGVLTHARFEACDT